MDADPKSMNFPLVCVLGGMITMLMMTALQFMGMSFSVWVSGIVGGVSMAIALALYHGWQRLRRAG